MKRTNDSGERRKYQRFYPDQDNLPKVSFFFDNDEKVSVEIINISRGGMLASTTQMENFLDNEHQKIKTIEIFPPNGQPFRCAGKLLRLYPLLEDEKCYCAVEFRKINNNEKDSKINTEILAQNEPIVNLEKDNLADEILTRVYKVTNYLKIENVDQAAEIRKQVYDTFSDITDHLSLEDRWWFFELLDEIKSLQPDCPEALKIDFLKLCVTGQRNAQININKGRMGLASNRNSAD